MQDKLTLSYHHPLLKRLSYKNSKVLFTLKISSRESQTCNLTSNLIQLHNFMMAGLMSAPTQLQRPSVAKVNRHLVQCRPLLRDLMGVLHLTSISGLAAFVPIPTSDLTSTSFYTSGICSEVQHTCIFPLRCASPSPSYCNQGRLINKGKRMCA